MLLADIVLILSCWSSLRSNMHDSLIMFCLASYQQQSVVCLGPFTPTVPTLQFLLAVLEEIWRPKVAFTYWQGGRWVWTNIMLSLQHGTYTWPTICFGLCTGIGTIENSENHSKKHGQWKHHTWQCTRGFILQHQVGHKRLSSVLCFWFMIPLVISLPYICML